MFTGNKLRKSAGVAVLVASLTLGMSSCRETEDKDDRSESAAKTESPTRTAGAKAFKQARLIVEVNATDGDAGLQLFLDHEPWRSVALFHPDGGKMLEVNNEGVLKDYGLTELFSESSEPSFDKFPLTEFKKLFPAGNYRLVGTTIEGSALETIVKLTHDFPEGPQIVSPAEDSSVATSGLIVNWKPVSTPAGIDIVGYQVLVVKDEGVVRTFSADLPATATRIGIPPEFLEAGSAYKVEVLAIEKNGNQTLSEVSFKVV